MIISVLSDKLSITSCKYLVKTLNKIKTFTQDIGIILHDILVKLVDFCHYYNIENIDWVKIEDKKIIEFSEQISKESEKKLYISLSKYFIFIQITQN